MPLIWSLFVYYLAIIISKLRLDSEHRLQSPRSCIVIAIVIQFSYLSVMFWLSAMCFNVWLDFRRIRAPNTTNAGNTKFGGFKHAKFKWYALYGWGIPLLVSIVTITMQLLPPRLTNKYVTPGIGDMYCFIRSGLPSFYYCYMVAGIAMLSTVVLFLLFVRTLWCGIWSRDNGNAIERRTRAQIVQDVQTTFKMLVYLGLTWILDVIAFALQPYEHTNGFIQIMVTVFLVINSSHGVILSCVFMCNRTNTEQVIKWLGKRNIHENGGRKSSTFEMRGSSKNTTATSFASNFRSSKDCTNIIQPAYLVLCHL